MLYGLLADCLVLIHLGFVLFVVLGGLLVLRWPRLAGLHLPAAAWGAWIEVSRLDLPPDPAREPSPSPRRGGWVSRRLHRALPAAPPLSRGPHPRGPVCPVRDRRWSSTSPPTPSSSCGAGGRPESAGRKLRARAAGDDDASRPLSSSAGSSSTSSRTASCASGASSCPGEPDPDREARAVSRPARARPAAPPVPVESVAALMRRLTGVDITRCPVCQIGRLRVTGRLAPVRRPRALPGGDTS